MKIKNPITKFALLFIVSLIALTILGQNKKVDEWHTQYFSKVAQTIINVLNPHVFVEMHQGAIENDNEWDVSFFIWDKREYDRKIFLKSFRAKNPPKGKLYQNAHEIFMVPTLFLLALFLASPLSIKHKVLRILLGFFIYYIFMALYLSYRFEFALNQNTLPIDSIWHGIIWFFGLGGNTDPIYFAVFIIWIVVMLPALLKIDWQTSFIQKRST